MKKTISLILVLVLAFSAFVLPVSGAEVYPESEHNYKDGITDVQTYTHPNAPDGMFITFSRNTYTERYSVISSCGDNHDEHDDRLENCRFEIKNGDYIGIEYGDGKLYGEFQGTDLAGKTIFVPSDTVKITLVSDDSVNYYGYKVTSITTKMPNNQCMVCYIVGDEIIPVNYSPNEELTLHYYYKNRIIGDKAIVGWQTRDGQKLYYPNYDTVDNSFDVPYPDSSDYATAEEYFEALGEYNAALAEYRYGVHLDMEGGKTYILTPIYCNVSILPEEVYSFTNSRSYFCTHGNKYFYTEANKKQFTKNFMTTFALSPIAPIAGAGFYYLSEVWAENGWHGSCCGFPLTVMLQHYGKIDMLSEQGVSSVSELEPTDTVISRLNFYNSMASIGFVTNNMGVIPGTSDYSKQLKKLYEVAEKGTPVYFEYYGDDCHVLTKILQLRINEIDTAHGVLLTGAYTDAAGNHILLGYNNNSYSYSYGTPDIYCIDKDFNVLYDDNGEVLNGFTWTDDISYLDSLPSEGTPKPAAWHLKFIKNLFTLLTNVFRVLFTVKR